MRYKLYYMLSICHYMRYKLHYVQLRYTQLHCVQTLIYAMSLYATLLCENLILRSFVLWKLYHLQTSEYASSLYAKGYFYYVRTLSFHYATSAFGFPLKKYIRVYSGKTKHMCNTAIISITLISLLNILEKKKDRI